MLILILLLLLVATATTTTTTTTTTNDNNNNNPEKEAVRGDFGIIVFAKRAFRLDETLIFRKNSVSSRRGAHFST